MREWRRTTRWRAVNRMTTKFTDLFTRLWLNCSTLSLMCRRRRAVWLRNTRKADGKDSQLSNYLSQKLGQFHFWTLKCRTVRLSHEQTLEKDDTAPEDNGHVWLRLSSQFKPIYVAHPHTESASPWSQLCQETKNQRHMCLGSVRMYCPFLGQQVHIKACCWTLHTEELLWVCASFS